MKSTMIEYIMNNIKYKKNFYNKDFCMFIKEFFY